MCYYLIQIVSKMVLLELPRRKEGSNEGQISVTSFTNDPIRVINDVKQIWAIFDPPPPSVTQLGTNPYALLSQIA